MATSFPSLASLTSALKRASRALWVSTHQSRSPTIHKRRLSAHRVAPSSLHLASRKSLDSANVLVSRIRGLQAFLVLWFRIGFQTARIHGSKSHCSNLTRSSSALLATAILPLSINQFRL